MIVTHPHMLLITIFTYLVVSQSQKAKVAMVTGADKGIGFEIVKGLCEKFKGHVYLTSRDENRGNDAINNLTQLGLNPLYHQLDIADATSIQKFRDFINATEGGIDIIINNAGVAYLYDNVISWEDAVDSTLNVNYFGLLQLSNALFPLLRPNARVINLASFFGVLSRIPSKDLRTKLSSPTLTIDELGALMNLYLKAVKEEKLIEEGWPSNKTTSPYIVSKVGVAALTFVEQRNFDSEKEKRNISINCVHPGYVNTDLTNHTGILTTAEGARAPLYLALVNHTLRGEFLWSTLEVFDWNNPKD